MNILNFGSLNLDFVYAVDHIVAPGETIASSRLDVFCGGKGLNQSVALARAGVNVRHAGLVGPDGDPLLEICRENGVDISLVRRSEERSGNAIIQVDAHGRNSIVLFGGANRKNEKEYVDSVLERFGEGDMILLQNEVNLIDYMLERAAAKKMIILLNPSPFDTSLAACDLGGVSLFLLNETEGEQITGENDPERILSRMSRIYPYAAAVLTLGEKGVMYRKGDEVLSRRAHEVPVADTTAAGDTFTGYFIAALSEGLPPDRALALASAAASIAVSRAGATASIPYRKEVETFMALP